MEFTPLPPRWSILIGNTRHELTLKELFDLRSACDGILEQRCKTVKEVMDLVCAKLDVEQHELLSRTRTDRVCIARFCVWRLLLTHGMNYTEIGRQFRLHHSTISSGLETLKNRLEKSKHLKAELGWVTQDNFSKKSS